MRQRSVGLGPPCPSPLSCPCWPPRAAATKRPRPRRPPRPRPRRTAAAAATHRGSERPRLRRAASRPPRRPSRSRPTTARRTPPRRWPTVHRSRSASSVRRPARWPGSALIGQGMKVYFDKINRSRAGSTATRSRSSPRTTPTTRRSRQPAVQEALEGDKIFASVFQIGTPNVAGTRGDYADACVPQAWSAPASPRGVTPRTSRGRRAGSRRTPSRRRSGWSSSSRSSRTGPRSRILSFNNDFGKTYKKTLEKAPADAGYDVVADGRPRGHVGPVQRGHPNPRREPRRHHRRNDVDVLHQPDDAGPPGWLHRTDHQLVHVPVDPAVHGACG